MELFVHGERALFSAADADALVARALHDGLLTREAAGHEAAGRGAQAETGAGAEAGTEALLCLRMPDACHSAVWRVWPHDAAGVRRAAIALLQTARVVPLDRAFDEAQTALGVPRPLQLPFATAHALCSVLLGTESAVPRAAWRAATAVAAAAWRSLMASDSFDLLHAVLDDAAVVPWPQLRAELALAARGAQLYVVRPAAARAATSAMLAAISDYGRAPRLSDDDDDNEFDTEPSTGTRDDATRGVERDDAKCDAKCDTSVPDGKLRDGKCPGRRGCGGRSVYEPPFVPRPTLVLPPSADAPLTLPFLPLAQLESPLTLPPLSSTTPPPSLTLPSLTLLPLPPLGYALPYRVA